MRFSWRKALNFPVAYAYSCFVTSAPPPLPSVSKSVFLLIITHIRKLTELRPAGQQITRGPPTRMILRNGLYAFGIIDQRIEVSFG